MDGFRFDALTRSLTAAGSRRRALVLALGGALGPCSPVRTPPPTMPSSNARSSRARKRKVRQEGQEAHEDAQPSGTRGNDVHPELQREVLWPRMAAGGRVAAAWPRRRVRKGSAPVASGTNHARANARPSAQTDPFATPSPSFAFAATRPSRVRVWLLARAAIPHVARATALKAAKVHLSVPVVDSDAPCTFNEQCDKGLVCIPLLGSDGEFECSTLPPLP